jgi:molybdopterin converting factor small subunit
MIKITVNLFASFRDGRFKKEQQEVPAGTTLRMAVAEIGIAETEIGMALVNSIHAPMEQALCDGDILYLAPWIGGG